MIIKTNTKIEYSKQFRRNFINVTGLVVIIVITLGIFACSSKFIASKKQNVVNNENVLKELNIPVNGANLYCKIIGEGRPVLFIHGGPGLTYNYFLPYMERLVPYGFQLILYDQRGNGKSTVSSMDSIKVDLFVQDIERIREKLGIDKVVLLGHSSGCYLAYLYALKYPEHVDAIIDCSAGPLDDKGFEENSQNWNKQLEQIDLKAIRTLPGMSEAAKDMDDESLRIMANRFYDKTKIADFIMNGKTVVMSEERGQEIRDRFYREMNNSLFNQKEYKKPKVKSLILHAAEDPIPLWTAEQWANILDARLEVISKSNHFPFVEKTDEVVRLINEFLNSKKVTN